MSFTNGIGEAPQPSNASSVGANFGTSCAVRTGAIPRNSRAANLPANKRRASAVAGGIAMDTAKVSMAGSLISRATRSSDVRFEKVAALQQAIAAGTYSVSSASVAEKLMSELQK
jgi:negative regulator of flagellin synthesis FlgM